MIKRIATKMMGTGLAAGMLLAGCAVDSSGEQMGSISVDVLAMQAHGTCPDGWIGGENVRVFCPSDMVLESRAFGHSSCVRCVAADVPDAPTMCDGSWRNARLMFGCAPGYDLEYSPGGECKRCVPAADAIECQTNEDCFRTGCSGEVCAAEPALSLCIWRPQYACYEDKYCGCHKGRCGFREHPQLEACLAHP